MKASPKSGSNNRWNAQDAQELIAARLRLGLTQQQLGDCLGATNVGVSRWERIESNRHQSPQHPEMLRLALLALEAGLPDAVAGGLTIAEIRERLRAPARELQRA